MSDVKSIRLVLSSEHNVWVNTVFVMTGSRLSIKVKSSVAPPPQSPETLTLII